MAICGGIPAFFYTAKFYIPIVSHYCSPLQLFLIPPHKPIFQWHPDDLCIAGFPCQPLSAGDRAGDMRGNADVQITQSVEKYFETHTWLHQANTNTM